MYLLIHIIKCFELELSGNTGHPNYKTYNTMHATAIPRNWHWGPGGMGGWGHIKYLDESLFFYMIKLHKRHLKLQDGNKWLWSFLRPTYPWRPLDRFISTLGFLLTVEIVLNGRCVKPDNVKMVTNKINNVSKIEILLEPLSDWGDWKNASARPPVFSSSTSLPTGRALYSLGNVLLKFPVPEWNIQAGSLHPISST